MTIDFGRFGAIYVFLGFVTLLKKSFDSDKREIDVFAGDIDLYSF